jgi:hypothetical protein
VQLTPNPERLPRYATRFELLESGGEPVAVGAKQLAPRGPDQGSRTSLEALFEERAVVKHQQSLRDVDPAVRVDADQVVVEGGVVDLGEIDAVGR